MPDRNQNVANGIGCVGVVVVLVVTAYLAGLKHQQTPVVARPGSQTSEPSAKVTPVTLVEALTHRTVEAQVRGAGLSDLSITLRSRTPQRQFIVIEPGTLFTPANPGVQTMVARGRAEVLLGGEPAEVHLSLDVSCANMHKDTPGHNDLFTVSQSPTDGDLRKLVTSHAFAELPYELQQFAVWTVTDNPDRGGFTGISSGFNVFGGGRTPGDSDFQRIESVMREAGIDPGRYRAFGAPAPVARRPTAPQVAKTTPSAPAAARVRPPPRTLSLFEAQADPQLRLEIRGDNALDHLALRLESKTDGELTVRLERGMRFIPASGRPQWMIGIRDQEFRLSPRAALGPLRIDVVSTRLFAGPPRPEDLYQAQLAERRDSIDKLITAADGQGASGTLQAAVWITMDNPSHEEWRRQAVQLPGDLNFDLDALRRLVGASGLVPDNYLLLKRYEDAR